MSMKLEYPAICVECGRPMRAGTMADWMKDAEGRFHYSHAGECPSESAPAPVARKKSANENYAQGKCANGCQWAYKRSTTPFPSCCHVCGAEWVWTSDQGWLEDVAA